MTKPQSYANFAARCWADHRLCGCPQGQPRVCERPVRVPGVFQSRGLAALLPIAFLVLSGCSADRGTKAAPLPPLRAADTSASPSLLPSLPPSPSSPAASGSASRAPATIPAEAAANTPQGASAFARFYFEELLRAYMTTDTRGLRAFAADSCGTCAGLANGIDSMRSAKRHVTGPPFDVLSVDAPGFGYGPVTVDVQYKVTAFDVLEYDGRVARHAVTEGPDTFIVTLERSGSSWLMAKIQVP